MRGEDLHAAYVILGALPGVAWLGYFCLIDRNGHRSCGNVVRVFLWGCLLTVPAGLLEHITNARVEQETLLQSARVSFFLIAPAEEFFKLLAVWIAIYRTPDFREPADGLIYSITSGLGFASVENVIYMAFFGPHVLLLRAVFATPAHVMFSAMWGYSMGVARFRRERELVTIAKGLLVAIFLHGAYNFLVAVSPTTGVVSLIPLMVLMAWLMNRRIQHFRANYPFPSIGKGPLICCPTCGAYTLEAGERCSRCGAIIPQMEIDTPRFCGICRARIDPSRATCRRCGQPTGVSELSSPAPQPGA